MRVEAREYIARAIDSLDEVIAGLEAGAYDTDRASLLAQLHAITDSLSGCAGGLPPWLPDRLQDIVGVCTRVPAAPGWQAQALEALRLIRDVVGEPDDAQVCEAPPSSDFDDFSDYFEAGAFELDDRHHADEGPSSAGAAPEFSMEEADPAVLEDFSPSKPAVPRMEGEMAGASPVHLGASAPAACRLGDEFTARFAAYVPADEAEVDALLRKLSPRAQPILGQEECLWQPGTAVRVSLVGKGLSVDPPVQDFVWQGRRVLLAFDVVVPQTAPEGVVVLKFDVAIDGIVVARLRMDLEIRAGAAVEAPRTVSVEAARSAFASYSSQDRQRVLDRVAALQISAGMDIFLDCLSLHPGEHWEPRLEDEIRRRDLFLLFWSRPASESKWVEWEWRRALAEGKKDAMEIHPLENGIKPPAELGDLHFADPAMAVRAASGTPP